MERKIVPWFRPLLAPGSIRSLSCLRKPEISLRASFPGDDMAEVALLCKMCSFGARGESCAKCGEWIGGGGVEAVLCRECSFGAKREECVVCGSWVGNLRAPARLCPQCAFGHRKGQCVRCGRWAP